MHDSTTSNKEALENPEVSNRAGLDCLGLTISKLLTSYDIQRTLEWIPGHCDLQGNERADRLARDGAGQRRGAMY